MKKFILGIVAVLTMTACCETNSNVQNSGESKSEYKWYKDHQGIRLRGDYGYVETHEYNGHEYVLFCKSSSGSISAVHSPDCPCLTK